LKRFSGNGCPILGSLAAQRLFTWIKRSFISTAHSFRHKKEIRCPHFAHPLRLPFLSLPFVKQMEFCVEQFSGSDKWWLAAAD
jgi:hypothetical protein